MTASANVGDATGTRPSQLLLPSLRAAGVAGVALIALAVVFAARPGGEHVVRTISDLTQLGAATAASVTAGWAAYRQQGRSRASWIALSAGTGGWAVGQLLWCYYELIAGRTTPMPSLADVGYLTFPLGAALALGLFPCIVTAADRFRLLIDGAVIVSALIAISWTTSMGAVAHTNSETGAARIVALAYPVSDLVVLTMAITHIYRRSTQRQQLVMLCAAMTMMAIADTSFSYLQATGRYQTGSLTDLGWVAAFLMLTYTAYTRIRTVQHEPAAPAQTDIDTGFDPAAFDPAWTTMVPYTPMAIAVLVLVIRSINGHQPGSLELCAGVLTMALVLVRQYVTIEENKELLRNLEGRERELERQAFNDNLTGLANRALFVDRLSHALQLHRRDMRPLALIFCDLDDFKLVNDTLGHGIGDEVLQRVAERLTGLVRHGDTLARLGGDEFAVLLEDGGESSVVASRIIEAMAAPFVVRDGQRLTLTTSVGVAEAESHDETPEIAVLLARADIAMYSAKRTGKGRVAYFTESMELPNSSDLSLRGPLLQSIAERRIDVVYQPLVNLTDGHIHGFEALARWDYAGSAVTPDEFIPIAGRAGAMSPLTDYMIETACEQLAHWSRQLGHSRLRVGVNLPPELFNDRYLPERVGRIVQHAGLARQQLVLEITEDALLEDPSTAAEVARRLSALGVRLSVDDFGKGYSSLFHLQQLPIDSLKIDKSFIADIDTNPEARRFAAALRSLGSDIGLDVVAEGIERQSQVTVLRELGYTLAQGFLFGHPVPAHAVSLTSGLPVR